VQPLDSSQHFMEPEGSLPSSQELSTCTYSEPNQSSPQHSIISLYFGLKRSNVCLKITIIWDVTQYGPSNILGLGRTYRLYHQGEENQVTANIVHKSAILLTVKMEAISSSDTSVLTRTTN
jgi:hypothetical protein